MRVVPRLVIAIIGSLVALWMLPAADAATRVGIHVTQEELNCWRQRSGTVANNSLTPNCTNAGTINGVTYQTMWNNHILAQANTFRSAPTTATWNPTTGEFGAWTATTNFPDNQNGSNNTYSPGGTGCCSAGNVETVSHAAFVYMVTGDESYGLPVKNWLLNHANNALLNFNNTTAWQITPYDGIFIRVGKWLNAAMFAYDYMRIGSAEFGDIGLTPANRITIETWLDGAAHWSRQKLNVQVTNNAFPNRPTYTSCTGSQCGTSAPAETLYDGGPLTTYLTWTWGNRIQPALVMTSAAAYPVNPAITWRTGYNTDTELFVKEGIMFSTWSDGSVTDNCRWHDGGTADQAVGSGWGHGAIQWGGYLLAADHLARAGDPDLYNFNTTEGLDGRPGVNASIQGQDGTTKNLRMIAERHADFASGVSKVYASTTHTDTWWFRPHVEGGHGEDLLSTMSNLFWNSTKVKNNYLTRSTANFQFGTNMYGGPWGVLPHVLFMWGNLEGVVDPYSLTSDTTPPSAPTGLTVTPFSASRINLAWIASTDLESPITNYQIYACLGAGCTPVLVDTIGNVTTYAHTGLRASNSYSYRVSAVSAGGQSALSTPTQSAVTLSPVLVGHWPLNGVSEAVANDLSGLAHHGSLRNGATTCGNPPTAGCPTWTGTTLAFDGAASPNNDHVVITRTAALEPAAFTLCMTITRVGAQAQWADPINKTWNNDSGPTFSSYGFQINPGGIGSDRFEAIVGISTGTSRIVSPVGTLPDVTPVRICHTYDPLWPAPQQRLYADDVLIGSAVQTAAIVYNTTAAGNLYFSNNGLGRAFAGQLSDVRLYNSALTLEDLPREPTPVASWFLDEMCEVTTASDLTGNGHTATLCEAATCPQQGPIWTNAPTGQALRCDGANDNATVAHAADLDITGNVSLTFWLRLNSTVNLANIASVVSKWSSVNNYISPWTIELENAAAPHLRWFHAPASGALFNSSLTFTADTVPLTTWRHIALVRTIANRMVTLFVNGASVQVAGPYGSDNPGASGQPLAICANVERTANRYGHIDVSRLKIYPVALTPTEITALYNQGG